jgi:hypothetical protein
MCFEKLLYRVKKTLPRTECFFSLGKTASLPSVFSDTYLALGKELLCRVSKKTLGK